MSEPKLCPFIMNGVACVDQDLVSGMWDCVENKCAMWRGTYCGLAGEWPTITRGPNPNVKAPDLVVIQEGFSPRTRRP